MPRLGVTACTLLALAAIGPAIVGCGGATRTAVTAGNASASSVTTTATKSVPKAPSGSEEAHFIASADAVCRRVNAELAGIKVKGKGLAEIARLTPRNVALESGALKKLAKLRPPASLKHDWRRMLGYRRVLANELDELARNARREDVPALKALAASKKRTHAGLQKLAKRAGFTDCAEVGTGGVSPGKKAKPA